MSVAVAHLREAVSRSMAIQEDTCHHTILGMALMRKSSDKSRRF